MNKTKNYFRLSDELHPNTLRIQLNPRIIPRSCDPQQQLVQRSIFVPPLTKSRRTRVRDLRIANHAIASAGTFTHYVGILQDRIHYGLLPGHCSLFWGKSPHVAAARSRTPDLCLMKDYNPWTEKDHIVMDSSFPNSYNLNFGESQDYQNTQYFENSHFFSNPNQDSVTTNLQISQNTETQSRGNKWDVAEDIALMYAWSIVSQNRKHGKNKRKESLWAQVKVLYIQAQQENPEKNGNSTKDQIKGCYNRLSDNASKWVGAYVII
ncbi:hypothetical protein LXL04_005654 [Taraxacum kok-saghyz]